MTASGNLHSNGSTNVKNKLNDQNKFLFCRNIFPENLAQAMFSHVKTSYNMVNVTKKRHEYFQIPDNFSEFINSTFITIGNITMVPVIIGNSTATPSNMSNLTKVVVTYWEEKEVRGLKYGDGINVLGEDVI